MDSLRLCSTGALRLLCGTGNLGVGLVMGLFWVNSLERDEHFAFTCGMSRYVLA